MGFLRDNLGDLSFYLPGSDSRDQSPDVVLVHGLLVSPRSMSATVRFLEAMGLRCAVPNMGGLLGYLQSRTVRKGGARLARAIDELAPNSRPWIIGHSMGGLLARHVVQCSEVGARVRGVITLGTPHKGTPMAMVGLAVGLGWLSRAPFNLLPLSSTVRGLNARPWPQDVPLISIVSRSDPLCIHPFGVAPYENSASVRTIVLKGLGHSELLWSPEVLGILAGILTDSGLNRPQEPDPGRRPARKDRLGS